ncbi:MAG: alpha/beta hydrolase-fold protein [Sphingomonas sp.]|jgi:enterochelin esterase-like enzyme
MPRLALLAFCVLAWLFVAPGVQAKSRHRSPPTPAGRFVELRHIASANIASPHVTVWLPPGYGRGKARYPVIYMQDGQNIFFAKQASFHKIWGADKAMLRLLAASEAPPAIIVAIWSPGKDRARQYMPQKLFDTLPAATKLQAEGFLHGRIISDAYLRFVAQELKPKIDTLYRTMGDPEHTLLVGSSMGGLISLYAMAEYPHVFGAAACLSTHWPLVDPEKAGAVDEAVLAAWYSYLSKRLGPPAGRRMWFDHGDQMLDRHYGAWQSQIDRRLGIIGWQPGADFKTSVYPGAAHDENAWAARLDEVFTWLLNPPAPEN